jgi:hypothetical protein
MVYATILDTLANVASIVAGLVATLELLRWLQRRDQ